jgi:hypothetical protein
MKNSIIIFALLAGVAFLAWFTSQKKKEDAPTKKADTPDYPTGGLSGWPAPPVYIKPAEAMNTAVETKAAVLTGNSSGLSSIKSRTISPAIVAALTANTTAVTSIVQPNNPITLTANTTNIEAASPEQPKVTAIINSVASPKTYSL